MTTVRIGGLHKSYGSTRVFDGLDLDFAPGVTALLGPNGAGKTTLMRCLATTLTPDAGTIRILGYDPSTMTERTEIRRRLGYLPQEPGLYPHFTAFELVDYVATLKELTNRTQRHQEVRRVLAAVDLADRGRVKVRKLSGGMRHRLALAQALLGNPELLILDEPTVGLDPEQRMRLRGLIAGLGERHTVLLSTHQTDDVTAVCQRVVVFHGGRVAFDGTPGGLAQVATGRAWLSAQPAASSWRTAEGLYRTLGGQPPGGTPTEPTIEDGYLTLIGSEPVGVRR